MKNADPYKDFKTKLIERIKERGGELCEDKIAVEVIHGHPTVSINLEGHRFSFQLAPKAEVFLRIKEVVQVEVPEVYATLLTRKGEAEVIKSALEILVQDFSEWCNLLEDIVPSQSLDFL